MIKSAGGARHPRLSSRVDAFLPREHRPKGLREQKKLETRARLLAAAEHLIGKHGFEETTMAAIARAAHVSTPTAFNYFRNKQRLLVELHHEDRRLQARSAEEIVQAIPVDSMETLTALLRTNVERLESPRSRKLWREIVAATVRMNTSPNDEFAENQRVFEMYILRALVQCQAGGLLDRDLNAELAARMIYAINRDSFRRLLATPEMSIDDCVAASRRQIELSLGPWIRSGARRSGRSRRRN